MTNEQIVMVKKTWRVIRDFNPHVIGDSFYSKLFSEKASMRRMFPGVIAEHCKELVDTLNLIIGRLDQPAQLDEELEALACRLKNYGVASSHYKAVGRAMLWTVEKALGRDCTMEILTAWKSCYTSAAEKMIAASHAIVK